MDSTEWRFEGTAWDFIHMVRRACAVYEYARLGRHGILKLLTDDEDFQSAVEEFGITFDAVKAEMRKALDNADYFDKLLKDAKKDG